MVASLNFNRDTLIDSRRYVRYYDERAPAGHNWILMPETHHPWFFPKLRVSSFLSWSTFKSIRQRPTWAERFQYSRWSGFLTILLGPRPDDTVIDITAISTPGITTLSIAVKVASSTRFSTVITALSTAFLISSPIFLAMTWSWHALISPTAHILKLLQRPLVWGSKVPFPIAPALALLPRKKSFKVSFNWLGCLLCWCFFFRV